MTLAYKTTATLVTMQAFDTYGGVQDVIQTWYIVADGGLDNSTKVTVEVSATVETRHRTTGPAPQAIPRATRPGASCRSVGTSAGRSARSRGWIRDTCCG